MDWLGEAEREMLHAAAAGTLGRALDRLADQEGLDWDAIPPQVTPIYADDNEVTAIRERLTPVREELRRHPETGPVLERLELLAGRAARPSRTTPVREELRDRRRSESTVQPGH
jgi:hypothetical protein